MRFVMESRIAASPESVFAFHEAPGALASLIPPWERVQVESGGGSLKVGSRVVLKTYLGPIPLRWVAEHTLYEPPHRFADRQVSGPFARWEHTHNFLDDGSGGTILRDEVDYDVPLGAVGRLLAGGFIRRKLQRMFEYRHQKTRETMEAARQDR
jgi:ligand-binding SRPBCC domain-containing protein